jgi:hypothetical protein
MKKLIFLIVSIFIFNSLFAQNFIAKSSVSLGGGLFFSSTSSDDSDQKTNLIFLNPQFDYFFIKNFSVGLTFDYSRTSYGDFNQTIWGVGPAARYYISTSNILPFIGISYSFSTEKYSSPSDYRLNKSQIIFSGGIEAFISQNIAIEPLFQYRIINDKIHDEDNPETGPYFFNGSKELGSKEFMIGIGIKIFLRK